eukprot:TRINITY_DN5495_c2_g1_i2.p2 TRINITY_DN5495_c2_g1~~TRINITY_DN5495_c2_g1_i2.p2  ORF type:complete len:160 (-),score=4.49 TRINITY_DN5495_c2_g1_i2:1189-1668(-)
MFFLSVVSIVVLSQTFCDRWFQNIFQKLSISPYTCKVKKPAIIEHETCLVAERTILLIFNYLDYKNNWASILFVVPIQKYTPTQSEVFTVTSLQIHYVLWAYFMFFDGQKLEQKFSFLKNILELKYQSCATEICFLQKIRVVFILQDWTSLYSVGAIMG